MPDIPIGFKFTVNGASVSQTFKSNLAQLQNQFSIKIPVQLVGLGKLQSQAADAAAKVSQAFAKSQGAITQSVSVIPAGDLLGQKLKPLVSPAQLPPPPPAPPPVQLPRLSPAPFKPPPILKGFLSSEIGKEITSGIQVGFVAGFANTKLFLDKPLKEQASLIVKFLAKAGKEGISALNQGLAQPGVQLKRFAIQRFGKALRQIASTGAGQRIALEFRRIEPVLRPLITIARGLGSVLSTVARKSGPALRVGFTAMGASAAIAFRTVRRGAKIAAGGFNFIRRGARRAARAVSLLSRSVALLTPGGLIAAGPVFLPAAALRLAQSGLKALATTTDEVLQVMTLFSNKLSNLKGAERIKFIGDKFAELREQIFSVAIDFGQSTEEISKGLFDIISAGVGIDSVGERMEALRVTAQVAVGGITTLEDAFKGVIAIARPFNVSMERAGDVLFAIQRLGIAPIQQLGPNLGRASAVAAALGISVNEFAGAIAAATKAGVPLSSTVTGLRQVFAEFAKGGSGPARKAIQALAATIPKFNLTLDASFLRTRGLTGLLKELSKANITQAGTIFRRVRALVPLLALLQDQARFTDAVTQVTQASGEAAAAAALRQRSLLFQIKGLVNAFKLLAVSLSEQAAKLTEVAKFFTGIKNSLQTLGGAIRNIPTKQLEDFFKSFTAAQAFKQALDLVARGVVRVIGEIIGGFLDAAPEIAKALFPIAAIIEGFFNSLVQSVAGFIDKLLTPVGDALFARFKVVKAQLAAIEAQSGGRLASPIQSVTLDIELASIKGQLNVLNPIISRLRAAAKDFDLFEDLDIKLELDKTEGGRKFLNSLKGLGDAARTITGNITRSISRGLKVTPIELRVARLIDAGSENDAAKTFAGLQKALQAVGVTGNKVLTRMTLQLREQANVRDAEKPHERLKARLRDLLKEQGLADATANKFRRTISRVFPDKLDRAGFIFTNLSAGIGIATLRSNVLGKSIFAVRKAMTAISLGKTALDSVKDSIDAGTTGAGLQKEIIDKLSVAFTNLVGASSGLKITKKLVDDISKGGDPAKDAFKQVQAEILRLEKASPEILKKANVTGLEVLNRSLKDALSKVRILIATGKPGFDQLGKSIGGQTSFLNRLISLLDRVKARINGIDAAGRAATNTDEFLVVVQDRAQAVAQILERTAGSIREVGGGAITRMGGALSKSLGEAIPELVVKLTPFDNAIKEFVTFAETFPNIADGINSMAGQQQKGNEILARIEEKLGPVEPDFTRFPTAIVGGGVDVHITTSHKVSEKQFVDGVGEAIRNARGVTERIGGN